MTNFLTILLNLNKENPCDQAQSDIPGKTLAVLVVPVSVKLHKKDLLYFKLALQPFHVSYGRNNMKYIFDIRRSIHYVSAVKRNENL